MRNKVISILIVVILMVFWRTIMGFFFIDYAYRSIDSIERSAIIRYLQENYKITDFKIKNADLITDYRIYTVRERITIMDDLSFIFGKKGPKEGNRKFRISIQYLLPDIPDWRHCKSVHPRMWLYVNSKDPQNIEVKEPQMEE